MKFTNYKIKVFFLKFQLFLNNMRKLITFVVILYTVINVNSYSQLSNNHKVFAARTELYEYNGLNALLSADSSFSFCLSTNARPFSNLNLYSGGINARSPLFYDRINIAMDFRGDFSPLFSNYAVAIGVISKITDNSLIVILGLFQ